MRWEFSVSTVGRSNERRSREKNFFSRAFRAGHFKNLKETGNCARKVSGTQGRVKERVKVKNEGPHAVNVFFARLD